MTTADKPINFLLVDDLEENLLALEALLQRDGLTCLKARSGEEALELLLEHEVALALLDVQMPGMDGFELAEFMRGSERARHIPIIFVTAGAASNQRRFRGYEAGAVDFIQKPIEAHILRSKANVFFDLYEQRRQIEAQRDELETAAQALRRADRHKDNFLAVLAHELRNPVAALGGGLHLLKKDIPPERAHDIRTRMERMLDHLTHLVDDLLDVSRVSQGKIVLKKARIELGEVLQSAIDASQHNLEAAGHSFVTELPEQPIWLDGDHTRLAQIVSNLLNNAAKYTPSGGTVSLKAEASGGWATITVSDTGVGVPADMQSRIFEIFAQVEDHLGKAQGGLGIGLALVKQLVSLHGGVITVTSAGENRGSAFTVRLPVMA
ncbi:hybrid sensor histidine kinase/response regulator [Caulobacter segnis]|uniref:histidine kinase n=2 Tax=Caulobacter segnis TaxID=88688 RepID=D5VMD0_CAUST|nr:hybrid sensor histidine kinase/response regulator [Caulobacter segnis]ADG11653.1 response regulator receiver sensor signal transduction histidine kinase [Caulobacter segnis ATCC 21756]AVQ03301.1 hybrid sensor histidine kinase/response regulator [Caulobacter segnis]